MTIPSKNCPSCPNCPPGHCPYNAASPSFDAGSLPRLQRLRRLQRPASLIRPDTALRIWRETPGYVWDVISVRDFTSILDPILSRLAINDWEYAGHPDRPPLEKPHLWVTGRGGGRVIRKERAIAWAMTGGETVRPANCWDLGAQELARLGFPGLQTLAEVEDRLQFLVSSEAISTNFRWKFPYVPWRPYSGSRGLQEWSEWGRDPANPIGWAGTRFVLPDDD